MHLFNKNCTNLTSFTNTKHTTKTHTRPSRKLSTLKNRKVCTPLGGLLVSCTGIWGRLWFHTWEGREVWRAINSTLGPVYFGTLGMQPCTEPQQNLPLALSHQQDLGQVDQGIWCRQIRHSAKVTLQTAPSARWDIRQTGPGSRDSSYACLRVWSLSYPNIQGV